MTSQWGLGKIHHQMRFNSARSRVGPPVSLQGPRWVDLLTISERWVLVAGARAYNSLNSNRFHS